MSIFNVFLFERDIVRLGEHDMSTTDDGAHQDIRVCNADKHEQFNDDLNINDIAMITLVRDVEFTG